MYAAGLIRCGLESLHRLSYQLHALKSIWIRVGLYITQSYKAYVKYINSVVSKTKIKVTCIEWLC